MLAASLAGSHKVQVLDADAVGQELWPHSGGSPPDPGVRGRGVARIAELLSGHGVAVIVSATSSTGAAAEVHGPAAAADVPFIDVVLEGTESHDTLAARVLARCLERTHVRRKGARATAERADTQASIVVVRDRDPAALQHPPRRVFGERRAVTYVHARTPGALPESSRYVFNLDRLDDLSLRRAVQAREQGAGVTLVLRHVDRAATAELEDSGWNVIPAYGDTEHIGFGTLRRALRMACDGHRVVARGFIVNSASPPANGHARPQSLFLQLVRGMSEEARDGERVVAAVLAPQRTGSQWLRDLIGWTAGSDVRVFHEHGVPPVEDEAWPESANLADALALEPDRDRQTLMRRAALRQVLLSARRRYIFMTDRDPADRLVSFFVKRRSRWLRDRLDSSGRSFRDPREIQCAFDAWLPPQVTSQARWFRATLTDAFGLDVRRAQPACDGLLVAHDGPNTLIVVPTERLSALREAVEAEYGPDVCAPLADNSAAARGDGAVMAAFRRQVHVPVATAKALRDIPEVAYLKSWAEARHSTAGAEN